MCSKPHNIYDIYQRNQLGTDQAVITHTQRHLPLFNGGTLQFHLPFLQIHAFYSGIQEHIHVSLQSQMYVRNPNRLSLAVKFRQMDILIERNKAMTAAWGRVRTLTATVVKAR